MSAEQNTDREAGAPRTSPGARRSVLKRATRIGVAVVALAAMGSLTVQCSASSGGDDSSGGSFSSGGSSNNDASASGGSIGNGGSISVIDSGSPEFSRDAFFAEDPPPKNCGDGGGVPPSPGGTPACPADKNLQGCPCTQLGQTAPCWPGYRINRNHGDCKDGTTTCQRLGETDLAWGACQGYTGIDSKTFKPLGTTGKAACGCFSSGYWDITNVSPCFDCTNSGCTAVTGATSSTLTDPEGGTVQCPSGSGVPSAPWSTDTVSADCTGEFKLCFTIKALSAPNAQQQSATDCVVQQVCTEAHYDTANQTQPFPDLPGWATTSPTEKSCAQQFVTNGGYAEMSVDGQSDECEKVQKIFQTVTYCPLACDGANPPASCANCTNGGGGTF
jgi:hypothetical protein